MTPAEHDKRQADSDAGMEQWAEQRPYRLRALAIDWRSGSTAALTQQDAEDLEANTHEVFDLRREVERLRGEVLRMNRTVGLLRAENATLRRKADAFDVIARNGLSAGIEFGFPSLLEAFEAWQRRNSGATP
jgi:hypothetical protein